MQLRGCTADGELLVACFGGPARFSTVIAPTGTTDIHVVTADESPEVATNDEVDEHRIAALHPSFFPLVNARPELTPRAVRRRQYCSSTVNTSTESASSMHARLFAELLIRSQDGIVREASLGGVMLKLFPGV